LEFFENEFTNDEVKLSPNDIGFGDLIVDQKYRRRGIGTALVHERIRLARERQASAVYTTIWESSPSRLIYQKLPFLPLLRTGPCYADGSAALDVVMRL